MNKLVLNPKARNHFKFMAARKMPESEKEQLELIESIYDDLVNDGVVTYVKSKAGNYSIRCVKLEPYWYIVVSLCNEFKTYNNSIYECESENDAMAICKVIGKNIKTIMSDYKKQILDAKKFVVRKEEDKVEANTSEDAI